MSFTFNGEPLTGYAGESVACALFAAGIRHLRDSPHNHEPRGMFCLMGSCQECLVQIDGRKILACQQPLDEAMVVATISSEGLS